MQQGISEKHAAMSAASAEKLHLGHLLRCDALRFLEAAGHFSKAHSMVSSLFQ